MLESTSSTAIPTTGSSLTSGPVYTDAREALTEEPIRAAAPLKSPICILFYSDEIIRIFIPRLKLNAFVQVKLR